MPAYDYRCRSCDAISEFRHGMDEAPSLECLECGSFELSKMISACGISVKNTLIKRRMRDNHKAETDMRQELREDHMVEDFRPVGAKGVAGVYNEVKASGSSVKDGMQATIEQNAAKARAKQREWKRKAQPRADRRGREMKERKAKEAAEKRKITVSSKT